jgi:hypothetical protein
MARGRAAEADLGVGTGLGATGQGTGGMAAADLVAGMAGLVAGA